MLLLFVKSYLFLDLKYIYAISERKQSKIAYFKIFDITVSKGKNIDHSP